MYFSLRYCLKGFGSFRKLAFAILLLLINTLAHGNLVVRGINYYSVPEIASKLRLKLGPFRSPEKRVLVGPNVEIVFIDQKRYVSINDTPIWLGSPTLFHKNNLYITESDFSKSIAPIILPQRYCTPSNLYHIIIDPGHGGNDEGTSNMEYRLKEKDLTLDVSIRLMRELEQMGYKVTLTRKSDCYLALKDRPDFANRSHADLFISIHFNSVEGGKSTVTGVETFILTLQNDPSTADHSVNTNDQIDLPGNKYDGCNALLGYAIQKHLANDLQSTNRGLRRGRLAVLKTLDCPGALVEAGFLSNNEECEKIRSPEYRQKLAQSIAAGVLAYHKIISGKQ